MIFRNVEFTFEACSSAQALLRQMFQGQIGKMHDNQNFDKSTVFKHCNFLNLLKN